MNNQDGYSIDLLINQLLAARSRGAEQVYLIVDDDGYLPSSPRPADLLRFTHSDNHEACTLWCLMLTDEADEDEEDEEE